MKQALRSILIYSVTIAVAALYMPAISYNHELGTLIFTAIVLGIANTFVRPILTLILLPINVITLGIAGLFTNALLLFLVTLIVPAFNVIPFNIPWGTTIIHIPLIGAYIITSFVLSFIAGIIRRIVNS